MKQECLAHSVGGKYIDNGRNQQSDPVYLINKELVNMSNLSLNYDPLETEAQIREYSQTWANVAVTGDSSVMATILADDFVGTNTSGGLYTKQGFMNKVREKGKFVSTIVNEVKVRFFDNVAVAQGHETFTRKDGVSGRIIWTDIYVLRDGQWKIVAAQDMIGPEVTTPA